MNCPVCPGIALTLSDRQGIEIDFCPRCRGVWLDRGELDKILERSYESNPSIGRHLFRARHDDDAHRRNDDEHEHRYKKSKTKNLLGELFDF